MLKPDIRERLDENNVDVEDKIDNNELQNIQSVIQMPIVPFIYCSEKLNSSSVKDTDPKAGTEIMILGARKIGVD